MGLSYNWQALKSKIDSMQPDGNTNQAIGLQWAWLTLTGAPFTIPPKDSNYKYQEVIILLTDGENTESRFTKNLSATAARQAIDARQATMCSNIKTAGITVYTVQVSTEGDPTSSMLRNCASDPSKFFILTSANAIVSTFQQIGTNLSNLRVAR
jgi:hypothetical protein